MIIFNKKFQNRPVNKNSSYKPVMKLQLNIIYGSIQAHRLERVLDVNVVPADVKMCIFSCLYFQYGWTDFRKLTSSASWAWTFVQVVFGAVEESLITLRQPPAYSLCIDVG